MKPLILAPVILGLLSIVSCDKAKNLASKAGDAVKQKLGSSAASSSEVDEALQKLVDQTDEGVIFRKDLPFPSRLEVRITRRQVIDGRSYRISEIGNQNEVLKGTRTVSFKLERAGNQVRHTFVDSSFTRAGTGASEDAAAKLPDPIAAVAPAELTRTFLKSGGTWKGEDVTDFRGANISKQLAPVFEHLLVEHALAPRPMWFSKRRFKPGDTLKVEGKSLPMLVAGEAKGSLDLTFESISAVNGHPCGVFAVKGDFTRRNFPDFEGEFVDEEVAIESGKLWLSLIYPVILREELETIQSFGSGRRGGPAVRGQGTVRQTVERIWKPG